MFEEENFFVDDDEEEEEAEKDEPVADPAPRAEANKENVDTANRTLPTDIEEESKE